MFSPRSWSIGTQTFWVMLGASLLLVWLGAAALSQFLHTNQSNQLHEDIEKRTALFSSTLMDAILSEDIPILETSLEGLVQIHSNLIGAEFCNYQNRPLLRWGEDIPSCHPESAVEELQGAQLVTAYREIVFEGERFGAIALRWDLTQPFEQLEQQIDSIVRLLVAAVLLLALILFVLVQLLVVRPIRQVDSYLRQVESSEIEEQKGAGSYSSKELVHLCEGVMALLESMAAEAKLRDEREQLLATLEEKVVERTQDLKHSNDQLSAIMAQMGDALFVLNQDGEILVSNPAAEQLFSQVVDRDFISLFPQELTVTIQQLLSCQELHSERLLFSDQEQNKVLLELTVSPLQIDEDNFHRLILIRDVTRQHDLEEKEQMIAFQSGIAEISASMMHNVGNILAGMNGKIFQIKNVGQAIQKTAKFLVEFSEKIDQLPPEKSKAMLQRSGEVLETIVKKELHDSIERIAARTQEIAEIIRLQETNTKQTQQLSRIHPRSFFKEVFSLLDRPLEKLGIEIKIEVESGLNEAYLPRNQLLLMLVALVKNGIEAIQSSKRSDGVIILRFQRAQWEGEVGFALQLEDNGIGIERDQIDQLFVYGHSSKAGSQGNGLHTSANFVKSQKGTIEIQSEGAGKGAIVEIWLPDQGKLSAST